MSRPESITSSAPCTPLADFYRPDGVTLQQPGAGQDDGSAKSDQGKDKPGTPTSGRDQLVKAAPRSGARARLDRLAGQRPPWSPDPCAGSGKLAPTPGRSVAPDAALERDPAVQAYRFDPRTGGFQVTRYDTQRVKLDRSGQALTGPVVKLDNREMKLGDAIQTVHDRAVSTTRTVEQLLQSQHQMGALRACKPAMGALRTSLTLCAAADALQRAGKHAEAGRALSRAADAYNTAASKLKTAKHEIENNGELTVGVLTAFKKAGEFAELVLVATGAGAVTKGLGTGAKLIATAAIKTAHSASVDLRDDLLLRPDTPVDWNKIGEKAVENMVWNLVSGAISTGVEKGLEEAGGGAALSANKKALAKLFSKQLARATKAIVEGAAQQGESCSPRQLYERVMKMSNEQRQQLISKAGEALSQELGSAAASAFAKQALEGMLAK